MKLSIWDILTILGLIAILGVVLLVLQFFINPYNGLNPFPPQALPPTVALPTSTPTLKSLPATWTPVPSQLVTETLLPSSTPQPSPTGFTLPTFTPSFTPTMTPTETPIATVTPTPGRDQAAWRDQSPRDGTALSSGADFDMIWTVENIGINKWSDDYYYKYSSGWDGHKRGKYSLSESVSEGEEIDLVVDMVAPKNSGIYTIKWQLYNDDDEPFYTVDFTFSVK